MLEAADRVHYLFSTFFPLFLQEAKRLSRNTRPMNFIACTEKKSKHKALAWCLKSLPFNSWSYFPFELHQLHPTGTPGSHRAAGQVQHPGSRLEKTFLSKQRLHLALRCRGYFFSAWSTNKRNRFLVFDQLFLGSGLSILLLELFALERKSYHDSAHRCCSA